MLESSKNQVHWIMLFAGDAIAQYVLLVHQSGELHVPGSHRCSEELDLTRMLKRELACAALMQTP